MCDVVFDLGETWRCLLFAFSILRTPRLCVAPAKRALRACGCARNAPIHASAYCALRAHYADAWCPQTEEKQTKTSGVGRRKDAKRSGCNPFRLTIQRSAAFRPGAPRGPSCAADSVIYGAPPPRPGAGENHGESGHFFAEKCLFWARGAPRPLRRARPRELRGFAAQGGDSGQAQVFRRRLPQLRGRLS